MKTAKPDFREALTSIFAVLLLTASVFSYADGGYIRTTAPLDEPRGYCLDVAGFGADARPDEPLRSHTCKFGEDNVDQLFKWDTQASGHVEIPAYNRCLAAEIAQPGAAILVQPCVNSDFQAWEFVPNGNLSLRAHPNLCLTVGAERIDAGSDPLMFPGYGYRTSTLETCRARGDELQDFRWGRDDEMRRGNANALREGMSAEIAQGILSIYKSGGGDILARTNALYESVPLTYRPTEVKTTADIAYGSHERQKLDVHVDTQRRGDALQPVIIFFHGGGYTRGSKEGSRNVGEYFASIGLVGVSATYRLAPEAQWPDGADDVGAAVQWVSEHIREFGGDPEKIFVIGKSAGGGHVATYAFRPEVLQREYPSPAGIILLSGSYDATTIEYFGNDGTARASKQVLGNVSRTTIPVLLTSAEYDLDNTALATLELAHELATKPGPLPRIRQLPGHNHYSVNLSIGTADRILSNEILDFVLSR